MKILVLSCDKNEDLFPIFHHCIEKYWPDHPEVIYKTETIINPYYKTIAVDCPLNEWTKGVREALKKIDDDQILLMVDDIFIRKEVDTERLEYASEHLKGNIACMNMELSFDPYDMETELKGWKKRRSAVLSPWVVSIMCGLWQKDKLLEVLNPNCSPWEVEAMQNTCGYDYYINSGHSIIYWGYNTFQLVGVQRGQWTLECLEFLHREGLLNDIDISKRGVYGYELQE